MKEIQRALDQLQECQAIHEKSELEDEIRKLSPVVAEQDQRLEDLTAGVNEEGKRLAAKVKEQEICIHELIKDGRTAARLGRSLTTYPRFALV